MTGGSLPAGVNRRSRGIGRLEHLAIQKRLDVNRAPGRASLLPLSVPKAVFAINGQWINVGKQSALCLRQVQAEGSGLATRGQQLPDFVHMSARLVFRRKLLQRDYRCGQRFRNNPFVVARDSLSWHPTVPLISPRPGAPKDKP
jgi:hypothetical protein